MSIFKGSIAYDYSGRKKKKKTFVKGKAEPAPKVQLLPTAKASGPYRRETKQVPSLKADHLPQCTTVDGSAYKQKVSSKYTIAPAYNKGAYQVILPDTVKDIGR